jgi:hypothetical protein
MMMMMIIIIIINRPRYIGVPSIGKRAIHRDMIQCVLNCTFP